MSTECTTDSCVFQEAQLAGRWWRGFDGGALTSDGGAVLLRVVERATGILRQSTTCFTEHRDAVRVKHSVAWQVAQRVYGLALGSHVRSTSTAYS